MQIPLVNLTEQYVGIKTEIQTAINKVLDSTAFIGGPFVAEFETKFAEYCGVEHCIGVGNGTDAITIVLRAMGIGPGDEVITAANSFVATSEAITNAGATVVFADCCPDTSLIDTDSLNSLLSRKTKAIIPVHLYGRPANMDAVNEIAKANGLFVIEDAAQAHGAELNDKRVGSLGDAACFSFYPGKNLGAYGDAGAVVTKDKQLAERVRMFANHGRTSKYDHEFEGFNSRLDGMQAAILSVKLKHSERWTERRREIALIYDAELSDLEIALTPPEPKARHVYHLYVVRVKNREEVQSRLKKLGISTGVHYPIALPNLTAYRHLGHKTSDFPVATELSKEVLSLPMCPELTDEMVIRVCQCLRKVLNG